MTNEDTKTTPLFGELPEALVDEMLNQCKGISNNLYDKFNSIKEHRIKFRNRLDECDLLKRAADIPPSEIPTTCGIDGSYAIERLLAVDIVATAAVAFEGLTPPSEKREWERPHHLVKIKNIPHYDGTTSIARAVMIGMELQLAEKAPHNVIFIDGSLTTPFIHLHQGLNKVEEEKNEFGDHLVSELKKTLNAYKNILNPNTDQIFVGVPKYTSKREIGEKLDTEGYDDKGLLTLVLNPGEYTRPVQLSQPEQKWHLNLEPHPNKEKLKPSRSDIISELEKIHIIYYRPNLWTSALRLELPHSIVNNKERMSILLKAIEYQSAKGIIEPYPLYIADRMVKHLTEGLQAMRQSTTQNIARKYEGDVSDIFMSMHSYRTKGR